MWWNWIKPKLLKTVSWFYLVKQLTISFQWQVIEMSTPSLVNTSLPVSLTPHMDPEVMNSTELLSTCQWIPPQHYLFQMANGVLLGAVACPGGKHGVLFMHSCFVLGIQLSMMYLNCLSSSSSSFVKWQHR